LGGSGCSCIIIDIAYLTIVVHDHEQEMLTQMVDAVRQRLVRIVARIPVSNWRNRDGYGASFNTPIKFIEGEWSANERLVETLFVHNQIALDGEGQRALEFGCTKSHLALELCSLGYQVVGVDLREYPFCHPNLRFLRCNLLDFEDDKGFDLITSISVLEHIGLGVYGEGPDSVSLGRTLSKLAGLLNPNGTLIVTVPVGKPSTDSFLRSFGRGEFEHLLAESGLSILRSSFFIREDFKHWRLLGLGEEPQAENDPNHRGRTGVNGVGCFVTKLRLTEGSSD
jgi:2-polyprenyl-3-methyl-5-hydroxy-6-metoxy-1,4-benzoquinol methylase